MSGNLASVRYKRVTEVVISHEEVQNQIDQEEKVDELVYHSPCYLCCSFFFFYKGDSIGCAYEGEDQQSHNKEVPKHFKRIVRVDNHLGALMPYDLSQSNLDLCFLDKVL